MSDRPIRLHVFADGETTCHSTVTQAKSRLERRLFAGTWRRRLMPRDSTGAMFHLNEYWRGDQLIAAMWNEAADHEALRALGRAHEQRGGTTDMSGQGRPYRLHDFDSGKATGHGSVAAARRQYLASGGKSAAFDYDWAEAVVPRTAGESRGLAGMTASAPRYWRNSRSSVLRAVIWHEDFDRVMHTAFDVRPPEDARDARTAPSEPTDRVVVEAPRELLEFLLENVEEAMAAGTYLLKLLRDRDSREKMVSQMERLKAFRTILKEAGL